MAFLWRKTAHILILDLTLAHNVLLALVGYITRKKRGFLQRWPESECGSINMENVDDPFEIRKG